MSETPEFGPVTLYANGEPLAQGLPVPEQAAPEQRSLTPEGAARFSEVLTQRLATMDNIMSATASQSLDAMEGASLVTDLLAEALRADPDAVTAVSAYRGPLSAMDHSARLMHSHQTGHGLERIPLNPGNVTQENALEVLGVVKAKVEDQRWDGTRSGRVDATTAHARKSVALDAARGLRLIAEQRGQAITDSQTVAKVTAYLEKGPVRY